MNISHSSLYAVALASSLLLIFLARTVVRAPRRNTFLVAFLVLQALGFTFEWLMLHPATPAKALWLGSLIAISFFRAPCLWLYARQITEEPPPRVRDLPRWQLAVIVCGVLLALPLVERTHLGTEFVSPRQETSATHSFVIHSTMLAAITLFGLQAAYYLWSCLRILERQTAHAKALFSSIEDRSLHALRVLIFVLATHWIVGLARGLYGWVLGREAGPSLVFALCEAAVTLGATISLVRANLGLDSDDRQLLGELSADKYARSALDAPARARIGRKLTEALNTHHLHRDSGLTLRSLCTKIHENPHYVSQVINQDLGSNFYDLVNRARVRDAMGALAASDGKPVQQIAFDVGFNSKSTFNAAFRQHAGMTPSQYRAGQRSRPD
ncbi:MAG TPA: helix-turn-helix domain-containing protein [Steroidobacteraceae bacterium]|nr:helix-turn-helix domain-containing protein [Steroidobacteraceae bacterium]